MGCALIGSTVSCLSHEVGSSEPSIFRSANLQAFSKTVDALVVMDLYENLGFPAYANCEGFVLVDFHPINPILGP